MVDIYMQIVIMYEAWLILPGEVKIVCSVEPVYQGVKCEVSQSQS